MLHNPYLGSTERNNSLEAEVIFTLSSAVLSVAAKKEGNEIFFK